MRVLYIEPFYGGSHKYFADGLMKHSEHDFSLVSLPPRFWKWRQSGSALYFAENITPRQARESEAMVVGSMCDLAHLKALRPDLPPALLYVHENQLAYPVSDTEEKDYRYGITDLASILAADAPVFNSRWNLESFITECRSLFCRLPDAVPAGALDDVESESRIIYPGVDVENIAAGALKSRGSDTGTPTVIWNHRHEHDKSPDVTVRVLLRLADEGIDFRIVLLGERFAKSPPDFDRLRETLPYRILYDGYPGRPEYLDWLYRGHVAVSSASHENFGIAMMEAMSAGCLPLCPDRLAYPELIPGEFHSRFLWKDEDHFADRLKALLVESASGDGAGITRKKLLAGIWRYDWVRSASMMDEVLKEIAL